MVQAETAEMLSSIQHLTNDLPRTFARLHRRMRYPDNELTPTQFSALAALFLNGPLSPTALAKIERVQLATMIPVITVLEYMGMIIRKRNPKDNRATIVVISAQGEEVLLKDRERDRERFTQWLGSLTAEKRSVLREALPVLNKLAEAKEWR
jgi:DNA-binding MarR family transcriptional regulator